jgi:hypothetical protein
MRWMAGHGGGAAGLLLAMLCPGFAWAQESRVTVSAAFGESIQPAPPYYADPDTLATLGGNGSLLFAAVDFALSRRVSLGAEASIGGAFTGTQFESYYTNATFRTTHNDNIYALVLKGGLPLGRIVTLSPAVGAGVGTRTTVSTGTSTNIFATPPTTAPFDIPSETTTVFAVTGGVDVTFALTRRFALLALFHAYHMGNDALQDFSIYPTFSVWSFRYGFGAHFRF